MSENSWKSFEKTLKSNFRTISFSFSSNFLLHIIGEGFLKKVKFAAF